MNKNICNPEWLKSKKTSLNNHNKSNKELNIVDLFCGCGGLSLGAVEACIYNSIKPVIKFAIDLNPQALKVYNDNLNQYIIQSKCDHIENYIDGEIFNTASFQEKKMIKSIGNVDILLAGPPCQGHSKLNNYTRSDDPRNLLYFKVIRFVDIFDPEIVLIENVKNIVNDKNGILEKSSKILEEKKYHITNLVIDTSTYGIAQKRIRHIQIATKKKIELNLKRYKKQLSLSDVIDDIVDENDNKKSIFYTSSKTKHKSRIDYLFNNDLYDLPDNLRPNCHKNKKHTYPSCYGRLKWDQPSTTITRGFSTMGQGRFLHPLRKRTLTPHEAARIQGFPDFFDFTNVKIRKDLHLMIANAVPPKISAILIDDILSNMEVKNGKSCKKD